MARKVRACASTRQQLQLASEIQKNFPMFSSTDMSLVQSAAWLTKELGWEVTASAVGRTRDAVDLHWGRRENGNPKSGNGGGTRAEREKIVVESILHLYRALGVRQPDDLVDLLPDEEDVKDD